MALVWAELPTRADGQADVHGGANTGVKQVALQENLAVGDGNHVGGNVCRDVAGLGFDDRQRGQAAAAEFLIEAGGALQQAAVQIEDIAGIGFAAGRAPQQERYLTVGLGVLGEIIVDDQRVAALLHELFAHCTTCVGRQELQCGRIGGGGGHDDRVLHGAVILQNAHNLRHGRLLLTDGDVDADQVLSLLVDYRIDSESGFAGLAVADDQLALAAADGNEGVDNGDAGFDGACPPLFAARRRERCARPDESRLSRLGLCRRVVGRRR